MSKSELSGVAYSYMRFSSLKQEQGDSIERQTKARKKWLDAHPAVTLDESLTLADLGVSAFRGKHRAGDKAALSQFIRAVETGRVKAGSFLIVESLDRLTREELGDAFELVLGLVNRGIRIVQLSPVESILEKPVNMTTLMLAVVELHRGWGESKRKSEMIGSAWRQKRVAARESGAIVTKGAKAWLKITEGKFVFRPGAKEVLRRIFQMATAGHGCRAIAKTLNNEKVKSWTGKPWYEIYIRRLLHGREVRGEFQQARRLPDGRRELEAEPVAGYYPEAVTEAEWQAAQVAARARDNRGGRPMIQAQHVNIFQGLLRTGVSGEALHIMGFNGNRVLQSEAYKRRGEGSATSFPVRPFEEGILSELAELRAADIFGKEEGPDEADELAAQVARLDAQLKRLADAFDEDDVAPEIADKVRAKNAERKAAVEAWDRAKAKAASPLSSALGESRGLIETLRTASDQREVRVRLRHALARMVETITCVFAGDRVYRVAAVRLQFHGSGSHRDYVIIHKLRKGRNEATPPPLVRSFAEAGLPPDLDLRKPDHAARAEKALADTLLAFGKKPGAKK